MPVQGQGLPSLVGRRPVRRWRSGRPRHGTPTRRGDGRPSGSWTPAGAGRCRKSRADRIRYSRQSRCLPPPPGWSMRGFGEVAGAFVPLRLPYPLAPLEGWPAKGVVDLVGWLRVVVVRIRSVRSGRGLPNWTRGCPGRTPLARGLRLAGLIRWRSAAARPASRRCGQRSRPKSTRSEQRRQHPPARMSAQPQPGAAPHPPLRGWRAWWSMWWVVVGCLWCFVLLGLRRRCCGWYRPRMGRDFDYPLQR